jgi:3-hydroxyisobutyrate dehydrogenase-like beta-hydroxyacid dehydrogenase
VSDVAFLGLGVMGYPMAGHLARGGHSVVVCLDEARRNGARLPIAALVDQFYADVQAMGGRRWDTSSLIARLDK